MIYFVGNSELGTNTLYQHSTIENCLEWLSELWYVCLDTETEGMFNHSNKIVMLQLHAENTTYVIDARTIDIRCFKDLLNKRLVVGQNLKFDYKFLKMYGIELNAIYDTFLAECCLTNGLDNRQLDLASLAEKYTTYKLDKSVRNQFIDIGSKPFTDRQIVYGVNDVVCLMDIRKEQLRKAAEIGAIEWLYNEFEACLALADIEYNGMGFDASKWLELAKKANLNTVQIESELDELVRQESKLNKYIKKQLQGNLFFGIEEGEENERDIDIKWSSPKQVSNVFKDLGLDVEEGTGERFLTKYQSTYPIIKKFLDFREQAKLVSTYGEDFLKYVNPNTGRIHTSFWQIVDTTRVSSGDRYSPNMQNLPANNEYRNCFIPRDGYKMVSCDFSGQELRLTAEMSKEPLWIDAFKNGEDLHTNVASMVFNVPKDKVKDKPDFLRGKSYRDAAKTINFGYANKQGRIKTLQSR